MVQQVVSNEANKPSEKIEKEFKVLNLINALSHLWTFTYANKPFGSA